MIDKFAQPSRRLFFLKIMLPAVATALLLNGIAASLLWWSASESDRVSIDRQHMLVDVVVADIRSKIAHDQESVTVWDDAVTEVQNPGGAEWIDANLGSWMASYFGHDHAYVLNAVDQPIYAFADGVQKDPSAFAAVQSQTLPLAHDLRSRLAAGDTHGISDRTLTLGASDLVTIDGRPAILSIKPIVSDTGDLVQAPGEEYMHVAVRYLDGAFAALLERDYLLDNLKFSWEAEASPGSARAALLKDDGHPLGYLVWTPFSPGSTVLWRVGPVMLGLAIASLIVLAILLMALRRRSINLSLSEAEVRHLAHHDLLTGLANRAQLAKRFDAALLDRWTGGSLTLIFLDLDHFKEVNDTLGHPAGDELLREFADRLRRMTTEADTVARVGGDEFVVLTRSLSSTQAVAEYCATLIETTRRPFDLEGTQVFVGASVGAARASNPSDDREELSRRADVALYHSKRSGRSSYTLYDPQLDQATTLRRNMERDLRTALERPGELEVYYQPLIRATDGTISGFEALLRWHHPVQGSIAPAVFIPVAEETGLILRLGAWVLQQVCTDTRAWLVDTVAVNASIVELHDEHYASRVAQILSANGMAPQRLELEITESAFCERATDCEKNITHLRGLGVRFALDDFGTGFSSLGRLHNLHAERLKIDRSFVAGFGSDKGDEAIVQAIVDLAQAVGMTTTAEGVETSGQRDLLAAMGCDQLQGFLLSRPLPAREIERLLRAGSLKADLGIGTRLDSSSL
ncbi:putative bifunctional diguanylate cyclase/phosphodiesterase [Aurantimonas endophytica]|uniref:Diguanylate cyclase (GGDEF)-like protein n=1 Tax=Aurantimonas endophytica TaxID=1522175 RepID=A0A7W6HG66_9HYPH|nr:EAL domain-containing protein [Aurantimonas endophytica]MBB4004599.1 diguanylate cyclase (GGDEF)-like protein [Aurantimonas endophytica]MCO6405435.1 EAL domain-containing protein [Aurantimonas endophytica]